MAVGGGVSEMSGVEATEKTTGGSPHDVTRESIRSTLLQSGQFDPDVLRDGRFEGAYADLVNALCPRPVIDLKAIIRNMPDFPREGVQFKDIGPLLADPAACRFVCDEMVDIIREYPDINAIASMDARGFLFGEAVALERMFPNLPVRKAGKLPGEKVRVAYGTEYSTDALEIQKDLVKPGGVYVVIDDLLGTGGTMEAAIKGIEMCGAKVGLVLVVIELSDLGGRGRLAGYNVRSVVTY